LISVATYVLGERRGAIIFPLRNHHLQRLGWGGGGVQKKNPEIIRGG